MGLVELGLVVRIIASTLGILTVVGGVIWMVRKNKYDLEQVGKELHRAKEDRDKEMSRVHKRLDEHESKIHESEKQSAGVMQHLKGLEGSIDELKAMVMKLISPGG